MLQTRESWVPVVLEVQCLGRSPAPQPCSDSRAQGTRERAPGCHKLGCSPSGEFCRRSLGRNCLTAQALGRLSQLPAEVGGEGCCQQIHKSPPHSEFLAAGLGFTGLCSLASSLRLLVVQSAGKAAKACFV